MVAAKKTVSRSGTLGPFHVERGGLLLAAGMTP